MKKLKVGVIGSGFGLYGLLPAFSSLENCKIVAICGRKTDRMLDYCRRIKLNNIYSDWQLMIKKEDLDAIAIAVIPSEQYEIIKVAIRKRINIFAEKPLTVDYPQAKEIFNLAKEKKIVTAIDYIFPEIFEWVKVKKILESKKFGELKHISVNWDFLSYDIKNKLSSWKTDSSKGGGALSFYLSHTLYYIEYFGGEILDLKSIISYSNESLNGGEVGVDLILNFKNDANGNIHFSCNSKGLFRHQLIFELEKATIILENKNSITKNFTIQIINQFGKKTLPRSTHISNEDERVIEVKKIAKRFIFACSSNKQMIPSFKEGLRVQELINIIRQQN